MNKETNLSETVKVKLDLLPTDPNTIKADKTYRYISIEWLLNVIEGKLNVKATRYTLFKDMSIFPESTKKYEWLLRYCKDL